MSDIKRGTLLRKAKDIFIPIHKTVELSYMATLFMGTTYFQRLSKLKQLGTCNYVYPGAVHTRFEHSIGVYYLAGRVVQRARITATPEKLHQYMKNIPELTSYYEQYEKYYPYDEVDGIGLTPWIAELIKIAGLMHDVGHGPYSHVFDDSFIKGSEYETHPMAEHEVRSGAIVRKIVESSPILSEHMTDDDIRFICQLIDPEPDRTGFVFQIISNSFNGLDVDKYDYIVRDTHHIGDKTSFDLDRLVDNIMVIDNRIVFPEQSKRDIYNLFLSRHSMHRSVYGHKAVLSAQYIVTQIMQLIDRVIHIGKSISDLDLFVKMTDDYILQYAEIICADRERYVEAGTYTDAEIDQLRELIERLNTHNLYPHIGTIVSEDPIDIGDRFDTDEYKIFQYKIGYVSGNKGNPLDRIYVYRSKDTLFHNDELDEIPSRRIDKTEITNLMPNQHQEHVLMVFRKDRDPSAIAKDKADFRTIHERHTNDV